VSVDVVAVVRGQIDEAADLVGRLRRQLPEGAEYAEHLLDRLAAHIEVLDAIFTPTAADLFREFVVYCGDEEVAVEEALRIVDARARQLRRRLGVRES
jgi:hypothetical protein